MPRKILLADDSVTAQNMGRRILSEAGYQVVTVNNGPAALKKLAELEPDLVILDIYMPGYGGLEVCQRIKENLETSNIPVLLTVGKLEPFKPEEARRVRADAHLVKPFEATELLAALAKLEKSMAPRPAAIPTRKPKSSASEAAPAATKDKKVGEVDSSWKQRLTIPPPASKRHEEEEPEPAVDTTFREFVHPETPAEAVEPVLGIDRHAQDITPEEMAAIAAAAAALEARDSQPSAEDQAISEEPVPPAEPVHTWVESAPEPVAEAHAEEVRPRVESVAESWGVVEEAAAPAAVEPPEPAHAAPETAAEIPHVPAADVEAVSEEAYIPVADVEVPTESVEATVAHLETEPEPVEAVAESSNAPVADVEAVAETPVADVEALAEAPAPYVAPETHVQPDLATDDEVAAALSFLAPVNGDGAGAKLGESGWQNHANGHGRWMAEEIALSQGESGLNLEQEWQNVYAAQQEAAHQASGAAATAVAEIEPENGAPAWAEPAMQDAASNEPVPEEFASSPEMEVVAESAPSHEAEPTPPAEMQAEARHDAMPEVSASPEPVQQTVEEPVEAEGAVLTEEPDTAPDAAIADVSDSDVLAPTMEAAEAATPVAEAPVVEAIGINVPSEESAYAAAASMGTEYQGSSQPEAAAPPEAPPEFTRGQFPAAPTDQAHEAELAAAWAHWRQIRESIANPQFTSQLADAAAAGYQEIHPPQAAAPQTPEAPAGESEASVAADPAAIASIVDSVLAELKPKLVAEIAKKLGKEKK